jgi:hypothetical protein
MLMRSPLTAVFGGLAYCVAFVTPCILAAADSTEAALEQRFTRSVHPFLETYCLKCHGSDEPEADLDLSSFSTLADVVDGYAHWELVLERLDAGDMPPKKAKAHPTADLRQEIAAWIQAVRDNEAEKNAGDPGPVLARRLSNAEYDYTIHDLTGVDLRPTREFPVDPANQAGFDNSGESLTMSPALLKKYMQAARSVAEHVVLKPEGIGFAPHPVVADTDRDKYSVLKIVEFYRQQPTDFADYFVAAWRYRYRDKLGERRASLADVAAQQKVSGKYLQTVWDALNKPVRVGPMAKLQALWRDLPSPVSPSAEAPRAAAEQMRDFVLHVREKIVPDVPNLSAPEMDRGSQTFVLWKNRQMAANRRRYDPRALQIEGAALSTAAPEMPTSRPNRGAPKTPAPASAPADAALITEAIAGDAAAPLEPISAAAKSN